VKDLDRISTLWALNIGQMVMASMYLSLGLIHGCPRRRYAVTPKDLADRQILRRKSAGG